MIEKVSSQEEHLMSSSTHHRSHFLRKFQIYRKKQLMQPNVIEQYGGGYAEAIFKLSPLTFTDEYDIGTIHLINTLRRLQYQDGTIEDVYNTGNNYVLEIGRGA